MEKKNIIQGNVDRFSGFADTYHQYRPVPPAIIPEILINYIGNTPDVVVDLGCGTGLSTLIWKDLSNKVIGVDPNEDMRKKAIEDLQENPCNNIFYQQGYGNDTGVADNTADIITCSSSYQWMEPNSTIEEVLRILKKGGAFAMYNHDWPPAIDWRAEKAYKELFMKVYGILDDLRGKEKRDKLWNIKEYIETMRATNEFSYIREVAVHSQVKMDANGFIGIAFSQGALQEIIKMQDESMDQEIQRFIKTVKEGLGDQVFDATYSYRMWLAVR